APHRTGGWKPLLRRAHRPAPHRTRERSLCFGARIDQHRTEQTWRSLCFGARIDQRRTEQAGEASAFDARIVERRTGHASDASASARASSSAAPNRRVVELLMQMSSDEVTTTLGGEFDPGLIRSPVFGARSSSCATPNTRRDGWSFQQAIVERPLDRKCRVGLSRHGHHVLLGEP
ncbi:MAG TPA: hypothetical protein VGD80_19250, partial [Kofleriaceae bacterium]